MKPLLTATLYLATAFRASHLDAATPITSDANSVILDHFDGSTKGTAFGNPAYVTSQSGLGQAVNLSAGNYVQYRLPTSLESAGTIEMWVKLAAYGVGLMNFNWNNTTAYPPAGHVLHFGVAADGKLTAGGWAYNPANMYAFTSSGQVPLGQWAHVAMSWSALGLKLYINGALSGSSNQSWQPAGPQYAYLNYWAALPWARLTICKFRLCSEPTLRSRRTGRAAVAVAAGPLALKAPPVLRGQLALKVLSGLKVLPDRWVRKVHLGRRF